MVRGGGRSAAREVKQLVFRALKNACAWDAKFAGCCSGLGEKVPTESLGLSLEPLSPPMYGGPWICLWKPWIRARNARNINRPLWLCRSNQPE